jgi:beta-lactamase class A
VDLALQQSIEEAIPPGIGTVAVAVRHVTSGASAGVNADRVMPPASTYKLGVLLEAAREMEEGRLSLDERQLLLPVDWASGAGVLQTRIGEYVTAGEALRLMIGISDNTAALAMVRRMGVDTVNADYTELGLARTHFYPDDRPDTTTAWELATLLTLITSGQAAGPEGTEYMLDLLVQNQPQAWIADGTPPEAIVAHKSGQLPGVRNDAALVYTPSGPYALVVLTDNLADERAGEATISHIASAVYDHFAAWLGSIPVASYDR